MVFYLFFCYYKWINTWVELKIPF